MAKFGNYFESGMSHVSSFLLCLDSFRKGKNLFIQVSTTPSTTTVWPLIVSTASEAVSSSLLSIQENWEKFDITLKIKNGLG